MHDYDGKRDSLEHFHETEFEKSTRQLKLENLQQWSQERYARKKRLMATKEELEISLDRTRFGRFICLLSNALPLFIFPFLICVMYIIFYGFVVLYIIAAVLFILIMIPLVCRILSRWTGI